MNYRLTSRPHFLVEVGYDVIEDAFMYRTSYKIPFSCRLSLEAEVNRLDGVHAHSVHFFSDDRVRIRLLGAVPSHSVHAAIVRTIAVNAGLNPLQLQLLKVRFLYEGDPRIIPLKSLEEDAG